jgi:hypothetical protein
MPTRIAFLLTALATSAPASACTLCHSDPAREVRAALFGPDLLANAAAIVAPMPILLAAWWLLTAGARRGR